MSQLQGWRYRFFYTGTAPPASIIVVPPKEDFACVRRFSCQKICGLRGPCYPSASLQTGMPVVVRNLGVHVRVARAASSPAADQFLKTSKEVRITGLWSNGKPVGIVATTSPCFLRSEIGFTPFITDTYKKRPIEA